MAPRRRSTKHGRKIANNKMKGGKNWCCSEKEGKTVCNEQGWAPTCLLGNKKYVCDNDDVTSENVTTSCRYEVVTGKNWCCDEGVCNEQGLGLTCLPGKEKFVCPDYVTPNNVNKDEVTKTCRPATTTLVSKTIGTASDNIGTAIKKSGNFVSSIVSFLGGKKSKRRKSNKNRRTNKRK